MINYGFSNNNLSNVMHLPPAFSILVLADSVNLKAHIFIFLTSNNLSSLTTVQMQTNVLPSLSNYYNLDKLITGLLFLLKHNLLATFLAKSLSFVLLAT